MARGKTQGRRSAAMTAREDAVTIAPPPLPDGQFSQVGFQGASEILSAETLAREEHGLLHQGEVLALNHAGQVVVGQDIAGFPVGRYGAAGLDDVSSVGPTAAGIEVTFASGARVLVDLGASTVSCSCGASPCPHAVGALYEALATMDPSNPAIAAHAETLAAYHADRSNQAALAAAAESGMAALAGLEPFRVVPDPDAQAAEDQASRIQELREVMSGRRRNPKWLEKMLATLPKGVSPLSALIYPDRAAALAEQARFTRDDWEIEDLRDALGEFAGEDAGVQAQIAKATTKEELEKLAEAYPQEDSIGSPGPITKAVRRGTARRLGLPIYEPDPHFIWDSRLGSFAALFKDDIDTGRRGFGLSGEPGTGKNSFVYELSAVTGMPVFEVDFAAGDSMRDLLGDTGLKDGNTTLTVGLLSEALCAKGGCIGVYNEVVEAPRGELTYLHNVFGSKANQRDNRFITFKSPEGGTATRMEIDPDSLNVATWNPDKADRRPHQALARRMSVFTFTHGTEEEEARRLSHMVYPMVGEIMQGVTADAGGDASEWTYDPFKTKTDDQGEQVPVPLEEQCPRLYEECQRAAKLARSMRTLYAEDRVEHNMDATTLASFVSTVLLQSQHDDAVTLAAMKLDFMFPQTTAPADRWDELVEVMNDTYGPRIQGRTNGIGA